MSAFDGGCHRCGRTGHLAAQCKQPMTCNKCGLRGHTEKMCGDLNNNKSARDRMREQKRTEVCHNCGQRGHMARECTSRVNCRMCGQDGHYTRECPRNGGSAASLIQARSQEAGLFAAERQKLLLQQTAGGLSGLEYSGDGPASAMLTGGRSKSGAGEEPLPPPKGAPPKQVVKGFRATVLVKARKMLNPLADEEDAADHQEAEPTAKRKKMEDAGGLGGLIGGYGSDDGEDDDDGTDGEEFDPYA